MAGILARALPSVTAPVKLLNFSKPWPSRLFPMAALTSYHTFRGLKPYKNFTVLPYSSRGWKADMGLPGQDQEAGGAEFLLEALRETWFSCLFWFPETTHVPWFAALLLYLQSQQGWGGCFPPRVPLTLPPLVVPSPSLILTHLPPI